MSRHCMTEDQVKQSSQLERDFRNSYHQNDEEGQSHRRFEAGSRGGHRGSGGQRGGVRGGGGAPGGHRGGGGGRGGGNYRRDDSNTDNQGGWRVESNDGDLAPQNRASTQEYTENERRFDRPQQGGGNGRGGHRDGGRGGRGGYHADPSDQRGFGRGRGGGDNQRRDGGDFQRRDGDFQRRDGGDFQRRDGDFQRRDGGDFQRRDGDNQRRDGGDFQRRDNGNQGERRDDNEHHQQSRQNLENGDEERQYSAPQRGGYGGNGGRFQGNDQGFPGRSSRTRPPRDDMDLKPLRYDNRSTEGHRDSAPAHRGGRDNQHHDNDESRGGRTQRAARLRFNNFDLKEVDELFAKRHNQTGISFDNYECIAVEIVPNDIEAVTTFVGLNIHPILVQNVTRCGYEKPTPVQKYGIPVSMNGKDLMACAQTGSGKTAAFLVPVVNHILVHGTSPAERRVSYPIALIMAPTRELALQIYDESRKLAYGSDIFCDVVYGGTSYPHHFEQDILVACPGRLKDIFDRNQLSFSRTKFLILDEADRMLEMGFEEQIEYLVGSIHSDMPPPEQRQTLMFSATFPVPIRNLAQKYLRRHYYLLTVGRVGSTTRNITQKIMWAEDEEKQDKLMELLYQQKQTDLVLIFVETKRSAEDLYALLYDAGIPTGTIHGDRKQNEREEALRRFKDGRTPILVATDVASRGLDIPNVAHVIQYDLPRSMDDYTHRIGRTGRAGNEGVATSFFNGGNQGLTEEIFGYLSEHEQHIPEWMESMKEEREMQNFVSSGNRMHSSRRGGGGAGGRGRGSSRRDDVPTSWDDEPRAPQRRGGGGGGRGGNDASARAPAPKHTVVRSNAGGGF